MSKFSIEKYIIFLEHSRECSKHVGIKLNIYLAMKNNKLTRKKLLKIARVQINLY